MISTSDAKLPENKGHRARNLPIGRAFRGGIQIARNTKDLGSCKTGESDICCILSKLLCSDNVIEVIGFFLGTSVIPKDSGTDNIVILIKDNKSVHLSTE